MKNREGLPGVVVLDRSGRVKRMTPQAVALLGTHFSGTRRPAGQLPLDLSRWIAAALPPNPEAFVAPAPYIRRPTDAKRGGLSVRLTRGPHESYLLIFKETDRKPTPDELIKRLGLSRRRAEVLAGMAAGLDNGQIAATLELTVSTVRKHIELLYRDLGVGSRAEAVAMALGSQP